MKPKSIFFLTVIYLKRNIWQTAQECYFLQWNFWWTVVYWSELFQFVMFSDCKEDTWMAWIWQQIIYSHLQWIVHLLCEKSVYMHMAAWMDWCNCVFWFCQRLIESKLFLFYFIYLLISLVRNFNFCNKSALGYRKKEKFTHMRYMKMCMRVCELIPRCVCAFVCVFSLQCVLIIGAFASSCWISCIGSPVFLMPESLKHKHTNSQHNPSPVRWQTHK